MKTIIAIIFTMSLSGCLWQTVESWELESLSKACDAQSSHLVKVASSAFGTVAGRCANGNYVHVGSAK